MAPDTLSSLATRSVGCAPWLQPLDGLVVVDGERRRILTGVVVTEDLDEAAVARRTRVSRDDAVLRLLLLADSGEAQLDCHVK